MNFDWYYVDNNNKVGPIDNETLKSLMLSEHFFLWKSAVLLQPINPILWKGKFRESNQQQPRRRDLSRARRYHETSSPSR